MHSKPKSNLKTQLEGPYNMEHSEKSTTHATETKHTAHKTKPVKKSTAHSPAKSKRAPAHATHAEPDSEKHAVHKTKHVTHAKKDEHEDSKTHSKQTSKKSVKKGHAQGGEKDKSKHEKWGMKKILGICAVALLFILAGSYFFYERYTYESTDDAMVQAHTTMLAPKVSGIVNQVLVDEHEPVKAGQVLVRLEQKDFYSALDNAKAGLGSVEVQYQNAKRDYGRAATLYKEHAITHQNFDHAFATYQDLDRQVKAAQANLDQAQLNLEYTEVRAPTDGFVSRKSVEVGMNAVAGTALMGFVQTDERWVIANFKETQLSSIKIGKQVNVSVDAIPDKKFEGIVESISPSSGATFTLFPPDNATGNFTKVVQRVPVKIYLKNLSHSDLIRLEAGLSAVVDVVKHSDIESLPAHPAPAYVSQFAEVLPVGNHPYEMQQRKAKDQTSEKTNEKTNEQNDRDLNTADSEVRSEPPVHSRSKIRPTRRAIRELHREGNDEGSRE
jgi:membrane fusion protein (multidrug efflux system)